MPAEISFVHVEPKGTEASLKMQMEGHCPASSWRGLFLALPGNTLGVWATLFMTHSKSLRTRKQLSLRDERLRIRQCEKPQTNHSYHYKILFCAKCYAKCFYELYKLTLGKDYWCQIWLFSSLKHIERQREREQASEMFWYLAFTFMGCWPWNAEIGKFRLKAYVKIDGDWVSVVLGYTDNQLKV